MRIKKFLALDAMGVVFVNEDDVEELLIPFLKTRHDNFDIEKLRHLYYTKASLGKISSKTFFKRLGFARAHLFNIEVARVHNL